MYGYLIGITNGSNLNTKEINVFYIDKMLFRNSVLISSGLSMFT